jgi:hypothetical protein
MISVLLLKSESEAKITHEHVHKEIERISAALGRDFKQFIVERDSNLYFEANEGALSPDNWTLIPRYGTESGNADSPAGYALFFLVITGMPFAKHHAGWADFEWECFQEKKGAIIEASRGFGKSVFQRVLLAFLIGLYPDKSSVIVRSAATPAQKTAEGIARIISDTGGWKLWFPKVNPKSKPGQVGGEWSGQAGYSVVDLSRPESEWATVEAARSSPTLTKFGIGSKSVLGARATLAMLADDLHDEENSASPGQLAQLITRFQEILEPARTPESRLSIIGTPWGPDDLLQVLPRTGEYKKLKTPITLEGTFPGTPTWPEMYDEEAIQKLYNKDTTPGKRGFKRNHLLNLEADIGRHFTYRFFPWRKIEAHWLVRMGIDFAHVEVGESLHNRSHFAISVTTQEPVSGAWIAFDGDVGLYTQSQSERIVQALFKKHGGNDRVEAIVVEKEGEGRLFAELLARLPEKMRIIAEPTGGVPKEVRWETGLESGLANERILISDKEGHPFLMQLVRSLNAYPNISKRGDMAADILDSMVWAHYFQFLEYGDLVRRRRKKEPTPNPYFQLAEMK